MTAAKHYVDKLRLIGVVSGLLGRQEFRWKWLGYGNYACASCGAKATDYGDGKIGRVEPCSRNDWKRCIGWTTTASRGRSAIETANNHE
jgi:hypothetical protein